LSISITVPAIVAPLILWNFVGLYYQIEKLESKMRKIATYDMLTNLLTRKAFFENSETLFQHLSKQNTYISLIYIDIDNFKQVNDKFGHPGGDEVLSSLGKVLLKIFQNNAIIGRIGGEEIAIIIEEKKIETLQTILQSIHNQFSNICNKLKYENFNFTLSQGVVISESKNISLTTLLSQADKALFVSKRNGRNCSYLYKKENCYQLLA